MKNLLVTGGAGFIGGNFVRYMLKRYQDVNVVNLDNLTYAGDMGRLTDFSHDDRHQFVRGDICSVDTVSSVIRDHAIDTVVHFAAESHVDRSIMGPGVFVQTNIVGTHNLLEVSRNMGIDRFVHVSTDEVYGSLGKDGKFVEETPLHPNSPYAASKASSDLLVQAYYHTYDFPAIVTRCSNNYGPFQFPEKLIPLMIINALADRPLPVYGDGLNIRDWLYVEDHCAAIDVVLKSGRLGETYNIGGNNERHNIDIVKFILSHLGKPESLIAFVKDRPGHDRRYAIDSTRITTELAWSPSVSFDAGLVQTIEWYVQNQHWWQEILSGEYKSYYRIMYENR